MFKTDSFTRCLYVALRCTLHLSPPAVCPGGQPVRTSSGDRALRLGVTSESTVGQGRCHTVESSWLCPLMQGHYSFQGHLFSTISLPGDPGPQHSNSACIKSPGIRPSWSVLLPKIWSCPYLCKKVLLHYPHISWLLTDKVSIRKYVCLWNCAPNRK